MPEDSINVWQHLCVPTAVLVNKSHQEHVRTKLCDGHLQDVMLLATFNLTPDYYKLPSPKQHQISHSVVKLINIRCILFLS